MSTVATLQAQIEEAEAQVEAARRASQDAGSSLAMTLSTGSLELYLSQLREELRSCLIDRDVEIVEFRLKGRDAHDGRLPLDLLSEFALNLHRSFYSAAAFRQSGKVVERITPSVEQLMDVQFAGIRPGSARVFVSAKSNPDLFGNSLAIDTIKSAFSLLQSDTESFAVEAISEVGPAGARRFRELLQTVLRHKLSLNVAWKDHLDNDHTWKGTPRKLERVTSLLGSVQTVKSDLVELKAVVDGMNQRGRLELKKQERGRKSDGKLYRVTYSFDALDIVRSLHLGDVVRATLRRSTVLNQVTRRRQVAYFLEALEPIQQ